MVLVILRLRICLLTAALCGSLCIPGSCVALAAVLLSGLPCICALTFILCSGLPCAVALAASL